MAGRRKRSPGDMVGERDQLVPPMPVVPPPRFVTPVPDSPVTLEHPIEYAGRIYGTIIRRRPTSGVLGRWFEQFAEGAPIAGQANWNLPIFVDDAGDQVPDEVLRFLDDDDRKRVFEGTDPFLPARLTAALELLTRD